MLANRFIFFKKSDSIKYAGPLCFYQFQFNNITIILIGESHTKLPSELALQYIDLFNKLLSENRQIRIFVEKSNGSKINSTDKDHGFIDCICSLNNENSQKVFPCDTRDHDHAWNDFMSFLRNLGEIFITLNEWCKQQHINLDDFAFLQNKDFVNSLYETANNIKKKITITELCDFFEANVLKIDNLAEQYSQKNPYLTEFLSACMLGINKGINMVLELKKKYIAMGFTEEYVQHRSLGEICVDMMVKEGDFEPGGAWLNVLSCYVTHFLDATIACKIWDEIQLAGNENQTIIFATGAEHSSRLAKVMAQICQTVSLIPSDPNGNIIMPDRMNDYLYGHFAPASTRDKCLIM